jgi:hypothetical protein
MGLLDFLNPVSGVIAGASKIIGQFKLDPAEKLKAEMELKVLELQAEKDIREAQYKTEQLVTQDMANLRDQIKTELASGDKFVSRARPMFFYLMYAVIAINIIVIPMLQLTMGRAFELFPMPTEMWVLFGTSFTGYAYLRSVEKTGGKPPWSK